MHTGRLRALLARLAKAAGTFAKRRWLGGVLAGLLALGVARPAGAWSASGHMLIAMLAHDQLSEGARATLGSLLEAHPRYREDFLPALPPEVANEPEARARWLFAYAATWPDVARGQPAFEHGTWHYVNLPLEPRGSKLWSCREARRELPASMRRVAAIDQQRRARGEPGIPGGDSILQALPNNLRTLADARAPREARALALSWVLHLVGDAHQPLHAVALFTASRFVTGDRGGNDIVVRERGSLHRVWDGLLGRETSLPALTAALVELRRDRAGWSAARRARTILRVDDWIDEGCELARRSVYSPAVLGAVSGVERDRSPDKPAVTLPPAYFEQARETARERALRAGLRLAELLRSI